MGNANLDTTARAVLEKWRRRLAVDYKPSDSDVVKLLDAEAERLRQEVAELKRRRFGVG